jgi:TatD DNase family protein
VDGIEIDRFDSKRGGVPGNVMIDTHCHLDQIDTPETIVKQAEARSFTIIAVTNLPSHYAMALAHLRDCTYVKAALGFHPLTVGDHPQELMPFIRLAKTADYIGEIGLDFSERGAPTKEAQVASFERILAALQGRRRFITIHSRGAVVPVLDMIEHKRIGPVVFHWFTGSASQLAKVISSGHYISINPAMLRTTTGMHLLEKTPPDRVLTETDAPFARIDSRATLPWDVDIVLSQMATLWKKDRGEVEKAIEQNFKRLFSPGL